MSMPMWNEDLECYQPALPDRMAGVPSCGLCGNITPKCVCEAVERRNRKMPGTVEVKVKLAPEQQESVMRMVRQELADMNPDWDRLLKAVKKSFPKKDAKEVVRSAAAPKYGFTGFAWPLWCLRDEPGSGGMCGLDRFCIVHGGEVLRSPTKKKGGKLAKLPRCLPCKKGNHTKHKERIKRKGELVFCTCAVCDPDVEKNPKPTVDSMIADRHAGEATKGTGKEAAVDPATARKGKRAKPTQPKPTRSAAGASGATGGQALTVAAAADALGIPARKVRHLVVAVKKWRTAADKGTPIMVTKKQLEELRKEVDA